MKPQATRTRILAATAMLAFAIALAPALPAAAQENPEQMGRFIALMDGYLSLSGKWVGILENPDASTFMAVEGIVEVYEQMGRKADAVPHLEGLLERYPDNRTVRNAVRFKLRDLYKETGAPAKALEELDRIIAENAG